MSAGIRSTFDSVFGAPATATPVSPQEIAAAARAFRSFAPHSGPRLSVRTASGRGMLARRPDTDPEADYSKPARFAFLLDAHGELLAVNKSRDPACARPVLRVGLDPQIAEALDLHATWTYDTERCGNWCDDREALADAGVLPLTFLLGQVAAQLEERPAGLLRTLPDAGQATSTNALFDRLDLPSADISPGLHSLEQRGLIITELQGQGGPNRRVALTTDGAYVRQLLAPAR